MPPDTDPFARACAALADARHALSSAPGEVREPLSDALERLAAAIEDLKGLEARLTRQQALLDERLLRVENNRLFSWWKRIAFTSSEWFRRFARLLPATLSSAAGSARIARDYAVWVNHEQASLPSSGEARERAAIWLGQPGFSVIVDGKSGDLLRETLRSLQEQVYPNWECCIAVRAADRAAVLSAIQSFENTGSIRYIGVPDGMDDISALNEALALATGDYAAFMAEGDRWSRFAAYFFAEALQRNDADLLYSDEDEMDSQGGRFRPLLKPDWSPNLLAAAMYLGRSMVVRRELLLEAGLPRPGSGEAVFHDVALRVTGGPAPRVVHIAKVLYHRRAGSRPLSSRAAPALKAADQTNGKVTVIVCSRNFRLLARCLDSVRATASAAEVRFIAVCHEDAGRNDRLRAAAGRNGGVAIPYNGPFNFSAMNNIGAAAANTEHLLFLNDDVIATEPGWWDLLIDSISDPHVGVAGAVLRYPSGTIQHAGIVCGIADGAGHIGRGVTHSELWPWLLMKRDVSAVTGACLAIRRDLFSSLGGFDEGFANNYNDVDLCLRVRDRGLDVVCVPAPGLIHEECQSRAAGVRFAERYRFHDRWERVLSRPDPYYSMALAPYERIALNLGRDRVV